MISPRSEETESKYQEFKKQKLAAGEDLSAFKLEDEVVLREFEHWLIIENRFPYDNMTSVNHMLIPRRNFSDYTDATEEEKKEHEAIRKLLTKERFYDAIVENFPRSKSVHRHVHMHLVRWKYTNEDGSNKSNPTH